MKSSQTSQTNRAGNTLVITLGVLATIGGMIALSSTSATSVMKLTSNSRGGIKALAAVELALARHEQQVVKLANIGDPTGFARWKSTFGGENYGVDYIGDCEVRWKVEPCITANRNNPDDPEDIRFIENPAPDPTAALPGGTTQELNDNTFLFRISAEARYAQSGQDGQLARAQGVRYAVMNKDSLFRYVIFYAPRGPKGDLELTHEGDVTIEGAVHTNGALYIGSKSLTNTFAAANGPSGKTQIGPIASRTVNGYTETNVPVKVTAVDGIFRLSKQLMYGALNGLPMVAKPALFSNATAYDADTTKIYPRDSEIGLTSADLTAVTAGTYQGAKVINPYRVKAASNFITTGLSYSATPATAALARTINQDKNGNKIPILGLDEGNYVRNDARDGALKGATGTWQQYSGGAGGNNAPLGFSGYARTHETGGYIKALPSDLSGTEDQPLRPMERQQIVYNDQDGDPTTDQHELAAPVFAVKNPSDAFDPAKSLADYGQVVEVPGKYLSLALEGNSLARKTDGTGWNVVEVGATALSTPPEPNKPGLVILERPVPNTDIWPGSANVPVISPAAQNYLPFAYGKQWRPSFSPFFAIDVSDGVYPNAQGDSWRGFGFDASLDGDGRGSINTNGNKRRHTYAQGGGLSVSAACNENDQINYFERNPNVGGDPFADKYRRTPKYYSDNWRFFHLKRPQWKGQSFAGVRMSYFKDTEPKNEIFPFNGYYTGSNFGAKSLAGIPDYSAIQDTVQTIVPATIESETGIPYQPSIWSRKINCQRFSQRFEGFIVPRYSEVYTFTPRANDGVRMWLNGELITRVDAWKFQGTTDYAYLTPGPLTAGTPYHFVLETFQYEGDDFEVGLKWKSATQTEQIIPKGTTSGSPYGLYQPEDNTGFNKANVSYIQCKIDTAALVGGPSTQKVGIMLRDGGTGPSPFNGGTGLSPLLSGRNSYIALLYSPTRGYFTQRRLEPSQSIPRERNRGYYVGGNATYKENINGLTTSFSANSAGFVPALQPYDGAKTVNNVTRTYSDWNREASLQKVSSTTALGPVEYQRDYVDIVNQPATLTKGVCDNGDGNSFTVYYVNDVNDKIVKVTRKPRILWYGLEKYTVRVALMDYSATIPQFNNHLGYGGTLIFSSVNTKTSTDTGLSPTKTIWVSDTLLDISYENGGGWEYTEGDSVTVQETIKKKWAFGVTAVQIAKMNDVNFGGRANWETPDPGNYEFIGDTIYPKNPTLDYSSVPVGNPSLPGWLYSKNTWQDDSKHSFAMKIPDITKDPWYDLFFYPLIDVNPYVTSYGQWSSSTFPQLLPWNLDWRPSTSYSFDAAQTHALNPEMWDGTAKDWNATPMPSITPEVPVETARSLVVDGMPRWKDDQPNPGGALPSSATGANTFLRLEKVSGSTFRFRIYSGASTNPADTDFSSIKDASGNELQADLSGWSTNILAGPCVQSGDKATATNAIFSDLKVKITGDSSDIAGGSLSTSPNPDNMVDAKDWDIAGSVAASPNAAYLASQYQVFFGRYDITEDFFNYLSKVPEKACASEEWMFSPREFWSQKRRWEDGSEKDPLSTDSTRMTYAGHNQLANRVLLGKTTLLTLNLGGRDGVSSNPASIDADPSTSLVEPEGIQGYLRSRNLSDAVKHRFTSGTDPVVPISADGKLSSKFNGLIYAARTNRYPWNPNRSSSLNGGKNPWSFDQTVVLPNTFSASNPDMARLSDMTGSSMFKNGIHKLQPYSTSELKMAPAFRPDDFSHGIRIRNATDIWWGYSANKFGESKTSFISPNALWLQGNTNTKTHSVTVPNAGTLAKNTPLAIFGDSIHLVSNNFDPLNFQSSGLIADASGAISGSGVLINPDQSPATDTSYVCCLVTHNIPTTPGRVAEGQSAAFIDTMMFSENWNPSGSRKTMNFTGSLVVMDSRRYTRAFLLDAQKYYGRTVFGTLVSNSPELSNKTDWANKLTAEWTGVVPSVYQSPTRVFKFNDDLLTQEGTPPFTPFGVSTSGVGGWVRIVE